MEEFNKVAVEKIKFFFNHLSLRNAVNVDKKNHNMRISNASNVCVAEQNI